MSYMTCPGDASKLTVNINHTSKSARVLVITTVACTMHDASQLRPIPMTQR